MSKITKISDAESIHRVFNHVVINTNFTIADLNEPSLVNESDNRIQEIIKIISKVSKNLQNGGLLFVYGPPKYLPFIANYLNQSKDDNHRYLFKYWIALECNSSKKYTVLKNSHLGLLMYLKTKSLESPTPFKLNTKEIRIPCKNCVECGKSIKDWGGKKHMMNPLGTAYPDVWSDVVIKLNESTELPDKVLKTIDSLVSSDDSEILVVKQIKTFKSKKTKMKNIDAPRININQKNQVINGDSIKFMKKIKERYPEGLFDLTFADPPYNLSKSYGKYFDAKRDTEYVNWCNQWLKGMYDVLKPGGALLVLNIPKWAVYHACFLSGLMNFQHWIVWDALSTPAGKLLPAHYSLLYFTKPGGYIKNNYEKIKLIEDRKYCLRASCIKKRKQQNNSDKEKMSDIWKDIHRIKHKKDRDQHPCQLPIKLMNRIIKLFTDEGDLVYDPFGGAGTTAISAKLLKRDYMISDIDPMYVDIARKNLGKIQNYINGERKYLRFPVKKENKNQVPKRRVEIAYIDLCRKTGKVLEKEEVIFSYKETYNLLKIYSGNFRKLKNLCKRKLEAEKLIK